MVSHIESNKDTRCYNGVSRSISSGGYHSVIQGSFSLKYMCTNVATILYQMLSNCGHISSHLILVRHKRHPVNMPINMPVPGRYWADAASIGPVQAWYWHIAHVYVDSSNLLS